MSIYDPELTFYANAAQLEGCTASAIETALRDAYEDGWLDARAGQLAGVEISECPAKYL